MIGILSGIIIGVGIVLIHKHMKYHELYELKIDDKRNLTLSGRGLLSPVRFRVVQTLTKDKPVVAIFGTYQDAMLYSTECLIGYSKHIIESFQRLLSNGEKKLGGK